METNTYIDLSKDCNKYVISLDSLDLTLLPYKPQLRDKAFLWTANNFLGDENYYEFEIKSSCQAPAYEFTDSFDGGPKKDSTHTFCHICNVTVPYAYMLEHVRSRKHTSFQKITDIALERVKKHKNIVREGTKNDLEYFCEHCVITIPLEDQNDHENTEKHKMHAAIDTFVNTFAMFYGNIGEDNNSLVDNESQDFEIIPIKINPSENKYEEIIPIKVINNNLNTDSSVIDNESLIKDKATVFDSKIKDAEVLIKDIETRLDNLKEMNNNVVTDETNERANIVSNLEQYITLLKRHSTIKLSTLTPNDQERILAETSDGTELVISVQNFHGFKRTGNKFLQCKICKIFVSNIDDHKVSEKHIKFVAQPFEDQHCLRRLADSLSHCVLCNEVIDNPTVHILFNEHIRKLEQALLPKKVTNTSSELKINDNNLKIVPETEKVVETKSDSTNTVSNIQSNTDLNEPEIEVSNTTNNSHFCELCNKFMHVNDIAVHESGIKHITNSKTVNNYLMRKEKDGLKCNVCETNVAIYLWAIEDHISSVDHIINYFKLLALNKIDKIGDILFCKPCSTNLVKKSEICHIDKKSHQVKLASYNIKHIASLDKEKSVLTKDLYVNKGDESSTKYEGNTNNNINNNEMTNSAIANEDIKNTIATTGSKDPIEAVFIDIGNVKPANMKQNRDNTPLYSCNVGNKDFLNDQDNPKVPIEKAKHQMMDKLISNVNNSLEELLKYFSNPPKIHQHLRRIDVDNEVVCRICTDIISIENSEKHINSLKHVNSFRLMMAENKLKLRDNRYICYACNIYVDNDKELSHIDSEKHMKRIDALKNEEYVLITAEAKKLVDKIDNTLRVLDVNENSTAIEFGNFLPLKMKDRNYRSNFNDHYVALIDNDHKLFCVLCRVLILNTEDEMKTHLEDIHHARTYKAVMDRDQIFEIDSGFVCGFCECTITNEFEHICHEKHLESLKKYPRKNFCFKCNVSTIDIGVREHITSLQHVRNVNKEAPAHYYCNICDLQLTNNEMNVKRHIEGFQHRNNCCLFEDNKVFLKNKKCFCNICEVHFSRECFEGHISGFNHLMLRGE